MVKNLKERDGQRLQCTDTQELKHQTKTQEILSI
jgi:hypothetical protein